jgi:hypothetical protein
MITNTKKGQSYSDVTNYAKYCVSPKSGDDDYQHGERVLLVDSDNLKLPVFDWTDEKETVLFARSLSKQFEEHAKNCGKDFKNKMVCGSIAFHTEDKVDAELALELAKSQVQEVVGDSQTLYVVHGDKEHLHVHFMSNFVLMNGKRYDDHHDFKRYELSNERLEIAHGLTRVQQRKALAHIDTEREVKIKAPKSEAVYLAEKGELTKSEYIKANVKNALDMKLNFSDFVDHLKTKDIHLSPNLARTDLVSGVSFYTSDMNSAIKGSDFGKLFTWKSIKEKTNYEQDRDIEKIKQCKNDSVNRQFEREITSNNNGNGTSEYSISRTNVNENDSISRSNDEDSRSFRIRAEQDSSRSSGAFREVEQGINRSNEATRLDSSEAERSHKQDGYTVRPGDRSSKHNETGLDRTVFNWNDIDVRNSEFGRILDLSDHSTVSSGDSSDLSKIRSIRNENHQLKTQFETLKGVDFQIRAKDYTTGEVKEITKFDDDTLRYLRHLNSQNFNIIIRPNDLNVIVLDDVSPEKFQEIKEMGLERALVVETSPDKYHVWFRFTKIEDEKTKLEIQKKLGKRFKADQNCSTDPNHFFRAAGFTNRKQEHCKDGKYPWVNIIEKNGNVIQE